MWRPAFLIQIGHSTRCFNMQKEKKIQIDRETGLMIGRLFEDDDTLELIETVMASTEKDCIRPFKKNESREIIKKNIFINRFFSSVTPKLIYGVVVAFATDINFKWGLLAVLVFALIDLLFGAAVKRKEYETMPNL